MTVVSVRVEVGVLIVFGSDAVKDKLAGKRQWHPPTVYSKVFDTVKTLKSINAIHHSGDCTDLEFLDVSSAVDCVQLALSIRYGLYMFGWEEGVGKQACVYALSLEGERVLWL